MKTGLGMLIITLLLNSIVFSQTVTPDSCETRLPCEISRRVVVDLLEGDLAKKELDLTQEKLYNTEQIINSQNDIITSYRVKTKAYEDQIKMYDQKEALYQNIVGALEKDKKNLQRGIKILGTTLGVVTVATIVGFLIH